MTHISVINAEQSNSDISLYFDDEPYNKPVKVGEYLIKITSVVS